MNTGKRAYIYALSAIMLWSTVAVAFKTALAYIDLIQLLFYSSLVSFLVLSTVLLVRKTFMELFRYSFRQYCNSAFLGFLNPFAYYLVLLKAYSILPAQLAQPLNYTWPVVLVLLSAPLLNQKLKLKNVVAILISFTGVFIISLRDNFLTFSIEQPFGIFLATSSSVIWALFWIFNVKDKRPEVEKLTLSFFFSLFYTGMALFLFSGFSIPEIKPLLAVFYVGFFEMGFTFVLWLMALQLADRTDRIGNLVFLSPFFSLMWINLFLKETIFYTTILGLIFIVAGIFAQQVKFRG
jgi:drug/metabolite transporter (DMT)-like permease